MIPLVCKNPNVGHVMSLQYQIHLVLNTPVQPLNYVLKHHIDGIDFTVFVTFENVKCFLCGDPDLAHALLAWGTLRKASPPQVPSIVTPSLVPGQKRVLEFAVHLPAEEAERGSRDGGEEQIDEMDLCSTVSKRTKTSAASELLAVAEDGAVCPAKETSVVLGDSSMPGVSSGILSSSGMVSPQAPILYAAGMMLSPSPLPTPLENIDMLAARTESFSLVNYENVTIVAQCSSDPVES
ncbi:unnamed protein product [Caretta caretta]